MSGLMGIEQVSISPNQVVYRLPLTNQATESETRRISQGPATVLFDHAMGATMLAQPGPMPMLSTGDLRIDWL
jgi:acyl-coenzyme A thioesterase PaaI-like protein